MIRDEQVHGLLGLAAVSEGAALHDVIAPFTGDVLVRMPHASAADVHASAAALRGGQAAWAARSIADRARIVLRFHDLLLTRRDEGLDIAQWETGKTRLDALEELLDIALVARHYARDTARLLRPRTHRGVFPGVVGVREVRHPKGLVGIISAWNYPLTLAAGDAIPALMAGNAVLLKPDPQTSLSALWLLALMREAGLPDDVMQVVPGDGVTTGAAVVDAVDFLEFTGSTAVGRIVARRCGERLIGCSLELGGKNAMIIRADADIARAAEVAQRACFSTAGQLCISMERIYVHESVHDAFIAALVERLASVRLASGPGWGFDMGTLTSAAQLAKVQRHVADAVDRGATVLWGGNARPDVAPFAHEPTVLANVTEDMILCDEETFGPVVAVYPVASDDEAVERANDTAYGLNASIISRDTRTARVLATRLRAGTVNINEAYGPSWGSTSAPMGGMGDSGLGRRHGEEGLLQVTEPQTIATQRILGFGPPFGWSDERWGTTLVTAFSLIKRAGLK